MKTTTTILTLSVLMSLFSLSFADHDHFANQCQRQEYQEWVAGQWTKQFVPAEYKTVRVWEAHCSQYTQKQVLVSPAHYAKIWVEGRCETKVRWVCAPVQSSCEIQEPTRCLCQTRYVSSYDRRGVPILSWTECTCKRVVTPERCSCQQQYISGYKSCGTPIYAWTTCTCKTTQTTPYNTTRFDNRREERFDNRREERFDNRREEQNTWFIEQNRDKNNSRHSRNRRPQNRAELGLEFNW
ncbi:MAG: hypothetical protein AABZ60_14140 [Planctomycetota bacterium]